MIKCLYIVNILMHVCYHVPMLFSSPTSLDAFVAPEQRGLGLLNHVELLLLVIDFHPEIETGTSMYYFLLSPSGTSG